jgi:hypothetical protein
MRRFLVTTLLLLFCCSFISLGWAGSGGSLNGHDLSWGAGIEKFPDLVLYKTAGDIKYFQNPASAADCELMADIKSSHVAYGFKNGKLYARILKIDTTDDFQKVHAHMVELYGEPKEKMDGNTHIDRWQTEDLKIKLKFNKEMKVMKMGTYHMPSAGKDFDMEKSFEATP